LIALNITAFFLRGLLAWFVLLVFAMANGTLGQLLVRPWAGEYCNHVYKSVLMLGFIYLVLTRFWKIAGLHAWRSRSVWLGLFLSGITVCFEFGFFHYLMGEPWEKLMADYQFWRGRLWVLVLAANLVFPYLTAGRIAGAKHKGEN